MAQYQHYIPQFLLRNFSHPYQPPKGYGAKKKSHRRVEKGKHKGDKVLNIVDLTSNEPQLIEEPVSRWFGQEEMYSDVFDTIKTKKDVEQELSKLESQTAAIIQKVKKAHENGDAGICLTRVERNKLRKFLFIMKYRGPGFFEKYISKDPQAYISISTHHMNIINSIFLDNLMDCNSIVFGSRIPFRQTLEAYMTTQVHGFKKIGVGEYGTQTTRLACLEKLAIVLKKLGVENVPIFCDETGEGNKSVCRSLDNEWLEVFQRMFEGAEESFDGSETPFWQTYHLLGGTSQTFLKDLEQQSWRLYQFQSQIMKWTVGLENDLRKNAFACVLNIILKHHPRRVWLYVKHLRWMTSKEYAMLQQKYVGTGPIYAAKTAALLKHETEDFIVEANHATDNNHLCILIYSSVVYSMAE